MDVFLLILLLLPLLLIFRQIKNRKHLHQPPGPPALPIIGNLHQLQTPTAPYIHYYQLAKKYGPLMSLKLGPIPAVVVSSAKMAKEVMKTHDATFASRPSLLSFQRLSYGGFDLALAPYGNYWREMRKVCVLNIFSSKRVQSFRSIREDEVSRMIKKISSSKLTNFSEVSIALTSSVIFQIAFGKRFEDGENVCEKSIFYGLMHETQAILVSFFIMDYFPLLGWVDILRGLRGRLEKNFQAWDLFYQEAIDEHVAAHERQLTKPQQEDIIDVLLCMKNQDLLSTSITFDQIKAILMNILLGGTETSATTIEWAMTELMKTPNVMKRAQREVRDLVQREGVEGSMLNEVEIQKLPYLKAVVKETLRLHPAAPLLIPHETVQNCKIEGYGIEPKTLVYINAWAIGRDPECWERPGEFWPDRFMGPGGLDYKMGQDFGFVPFGAGRRGCPGMNLAVVTVELAVANLLYSFDWELPTGMTREDIDFDVLPGITVHKRTPLCLVPKKFEV